MLGGDIFGLSYKDFSCILEGILFTDVSEN